MQESAPKRIAEVSSATSHTILLGRPIVVVSAPADMSPVDRESLHQKMRERLPEDTPHDPIPIDIEHLTIEELDFLRPNWLVILCPANGWEQTCRVMAWLALPKNSRINKLIMFSGYPGIKQPHS